MAPKRGFQGKPTGEPSPKAPKPDADAKVQTAKDRAAFLGLFEELVKELVDAEKADGQLSYAVEWLERMHKYNVPHGKLNRGLAVLDGMRALKGSYVTVADERAAMIVGWGIEWLQAYFLVADDIMDESITRRGQPCWYRVEGVGMNAVNDGILLEMAIYRVLRKHLREHPMYLELLELFLEVTNTTAGGQLIDLITAPIGVVDLSKYKMETYMRIVTYKTAIYTFYLPAACAMLLCGINGEGELKIAKEISIELGRYFQIQDDVLDCYGAPEVIGKIGTDIEDNKCSWLVCQALLKCTPEQRAVIEANYGQKEPEKVAAIKALYKELDLEAVFAEYEEESYARLNKLIFDQKKLPHELFSAMLAKIYKRAK